MYDLSYRYYRGKALIALGDRKAGEEEISDFQELIEAGIAQKDFGYFATTPFFDCFIQSPEKARRKFYQPLKDLCYYRRE